MGEMQVRRRLTYLVAAMIASGLIASWTAGSPLGLLAPFLSFFLAARGGVVHILMVMCALGLVVSGLTAISIVGVNQQYALSWAVMFALAGSSGMILRYIIQTRHLGQVHKFLANGSDRGAMDTTFPPNFPALNSIHPDDWRAAAYGLSRAFWTGVPQVLRLRQLQADGSYLSADTRLEPGYGISVDIDDLAPKIGVPAVASKSASADELPAVRAAKVIENLFGNGWALDAQGKWLYLPEFAQTTLGVTPDDLNSSTAEGELSWKQLMHPDEYDEVAAKWRHAVETGGLFSAEYHIKRATGIYAWARTAARPTHDGQGRITGWYGTSLDMDVYKKTEEALRERERQLQQLIGALPALIYSSLPDGKPIYRSQKLEAYLGFGLADKDVSKASPINDTLDLIIHPDDVAAVKASYTHSLLTGEPYAMKHRLRRHDGVYRWVETRAEAMRNSDGVIVRWNGICFDIEEQVRSYEELRVAQEKLSRASQAASLAELSASIAHEIGQPLATLVSSSDVCDRWLSAEPPNIDRARIAARRVVSSAKIANDVVSRIRALFKHSDEARQITDYGQVIDEVLSLVRDGANRRHVRLQAEVDREIPDVFIDRVQIQQVLINLILNGMEAMDGDIVRKSLLVRTSHSDNSIRTEVSDFGPGVEFPDRIFEPFFTTKEQGMGMGLAICRTVIESHGGRLWVQSNEPTGSKFVFTLPLNL